MNLNRPKSKASNSSKKPNESIDVLYQRLGNQWFAFSMVDDEVFVGRVPEEVVREATDSEKQAKGIKLHKVTGKS